jgi:hypothetical protein
MRRAFAGTTLIEKYDAVALGIVELSILGCDASTGPAMQKHHRLAFRIPDLLVINLVDV